MPSYPVNKLSSKRIIISLGGSLAAPDDVAVEYLKEFKKFILKNIDLGFSFVLVVGGGGPARKYIKAASDILDNDLKNDDKDWLGIHATRFNAHLIRTIFRHQAQPTIVTNPEKGKISDKYKIIVGSGWKPGWSTDFVANKIAERYDAPLVINLSNISQVYTSDPQKDPDAKPINDMKWEDFQKIVGEEWIPGMNVPYDPIAAKLAKKVGTTVLVVNGQNLDNLQKCLEGEEFIGTMLHN